jgi:hypothetical protein
MLPPVNKVLLKTLLYDGLKILLRLTMLFTFSSLFDFVALCDSQINIEDSKSEAKPTNYRLMSFLAIAGIAIVSIFMLKYGITLEASAAPAPPPIQVFDPDPQRSEGLILKAIREFLEWVDNRRGGR